MAFIPESVQGFIQVQVPQLCRDISLHTGKDNPPCEDLRMSCKNTLGLELGVFFSSLDIGIRAGSVLFLHHLCLLASSSHPLGLVSIFFSLVEI